MEERLSLEFLRVVENAAIASARTMGFGDRPKADEVAVEAMRKTMDQVEMDGTIVIGEGERDEAPMLYIGEKVGTRHARARSRLSRGGHRGRSAGRHQSLRHRRAKRHHRAGRAASAAACCTRPICTWKKSSWARVQRRRRSGRAGAATTCKPIAKRLDRDVEDLVVMVLDRAATRETDRAIFAPPALASG